MNRAELRQLASERIDDAHVLMANARWSAAYYIAGYAVEIALKACIMKLVEETGVIFTDRKFVEKCWTHNVDDLVKQAGLEAARGLDISSNSALRENWATVRLWTEASRYEKLSEAEARTLVEAITHLPDGVYQWIQQHW